jgi:peptidoglycan/xylan/chitin deacetylase (PgdA/CDA1 family)
MRAILTYHSIDPSGSPISLDRNEFDRHLTWFASGNVRVTTIDQLLSLPESEDAVAITFDDGYANFAEIAAPRLLALGLPVTLFVVSDRVGGTNAWNGRLDRRVPQLDLLDWPALSRLHEQGVTLGAHSRTHADLTQIAATAIEDEVAGSAGAIQRETGVRPQLFAYPYGRLNGSVCQVVATTYRYGCTTEFATLSDVVAPAALPRLDMHYFRDSHRLEDWGTRTLSRFITLRSRIRRLRQRLVRA